MSYPSYQWSARKLFGVWGSIAMSLLLITVSGCWIFPQWNVWQRELAGKAQLMEAEWSRRIAIEEAKARMESATHDQQAEVIRARGVAEANAIIGKSLQGNEAYLRYLWIQGLHDGTSETIYIPTEANLPILEASRRRGIQE